MRRLSLIIITALAITAFAQTNPFTANFDEDEPNDASEVNSEEDEPSDEEEVKKPPVVKSKKAIKEEESDEEEDKPKKSKLSKEKKSDSEGLKYGIRTGFNMIQYFEDDFYPDMVFGYGAGFAIKYPLSGDFSIYSELAFHFRQICDHEEPGPDGNQRTYVAYEYAVSVPVLLQFSPIENFHIAAGFQVDVPRWSMKETNGIGEDITEFRGVDFGAVLELGYMVMPNIAIDLRGIIGMTPFVEIEGKGYGKLRQYGIGATYFFKTE